MGVARILGGGFRFLETWSWIWLASSSSQAETHTRIMGFRVWQRQTSITRMGFSCLIVLALCWL